MAAVVMGADCVRREEKAAVPLGTFGAVLSITVLNSLLTILRVE